MRSASTLAFLLVAVSLPSAGLAQDGEEAALTEGDRLRIRTSDGREIVGRLDSLAGGTLSVLPTDGRWGGVRRIPLTEVVAIDRSAGQQRNPH
jgi:hypothetical protein